MTRIPGMPGGGTVILRAHQAHALLRQAIGALAAGNAATALDLLRLVEPELLKVCDDLHEARHLIAQALAIARQLQATEPPPECCSGEA